ncbi:hypothetical protein ACOME3_005936 [Neoechinorhynchus agilis]
MKLLHLMLLVTLTKHSLNQISIVEPRPDLICYSCDTVIAGSKLNFIDDPCAYRTSDLDIVNCTELMTRTSGHTNHRSYCIFYILKNKLSKERRFVRSCAPTSKFILEDKQQKLVDLLLMGGRNQNDNDKHGYGRYRRASKPRGSVLQYEVEYEKECDSMLCNGEYLEKNEAIQVRSEHTFRRIIISTLLCIL